MKKLTKFFDLPLVQRFLDNRWAIGVACAVMVATGVVVAMLTSGGSEPASDAKPSIRDSAAQAAQSQEQASRQQSETQQRQPQASAPHEGRATAPSGEGHQQRPPSAGEHHLGVTFDNGTHFVGGAVAPGTYTTTGTNGDPAGCQWARLADNGGELVPILSGSAHGQTHITVHHGEYVRSTGCQTWTRSDSHKGYGGK